MEAMSKERNQEFFWDEGKGEGPLLGGDLNEQPNKAALFPHHEGPPLQGP